MSGILQSSVKKKHPVVPNNSIISLLPMVRMCSNVFDTTFKEIITNHPTSGGDEIDLFIPEDIVNINNETEERKIRKIINCLTKGKHALEKWRCEDEVTLEEIKNINNFKDKKIITKIIRNLITSCNDITNLNGITDPSKICDTIDCFIVQKKYPNTEHPYCSVENVFLTDWQQITNINEITNKTIIKKIIDSLTKLNQCSFIESPQAKKECLRDLFNEEDDSCEYGDEACHGPGRPEEDEYGELTQCTFIKDPKLKKECEENVHHTDDSCEYGDEKCENAKKGNEYGELNQCTFIKDPKLKKECEENAHHTDDSCEYGDEACENAKKENGEQTQCTFIKDPKLKKECEEHVYDGPVDESPEYVP